MKEDKEVRLQRIYKAIMLVVLTAFITFMITSLSLYKYYSNNSIVVQSVTDNIQTYSSLKSSMSKIKNVIDKYYLWNDDIDEQKLEEGATKGYVEALGDEYTEYISADEMKEFTEEITGTFVGIGIYMIADEEYGIVVSAPIPESPAEAAGIQSGDIIKSVDGKEYGYEDFDVIADYIKGEEGTNVKIVVERNGENLEFGITRKKIVTNPITTKLIDNEIGYLNLPSFDTNSAKNFKSKVEELEKQGAKSLIIDLRNNGGGIVDESTQIADFLLEKGKTIMTTKDNKDNEEITKSESDMIFDLPIVVIANENSASASEILIGALKDNERATIIGTKTYGKGVIQTIITLHDGSGLKITTAEYFTPNGSAIHKVGIIPNIEVELPETIKSIYSLKEEDDTQLKRAIEELKK